MAVGKNHVGGEGSCWWGKIMLVLQDDEERRNVVFAPKKSTFSQNGLPCVPSQHKSQQTICRLAVYLVKLKIPRETGPM